MRLLLGLRAATFFLCTWIAGFAVADLPIESVEFCVTVPSLLHIVPPAGPISITHDGVSSDQPFSPSTYGIVCNQLDGGTVVFQTASAFINSSNLTTLRDASLSLSLVSADAGTDWAIDVASDQTDVGATIPDLTAEVQASSTAAGDAQMELTVEMNGGATSALPPGVYCITVVATVSAN